MSPKTRLKIALLISGAGTTMEAIIKACNEGRLKYVKPVLVITSDPNSGGIEKAKKLGIVEKDILTIISKDFATPEEFGRKINSECKKRGVNFIGQYGWLPKTPENVIKNFGGMIVNQHPVPLDPGRLDFGGKGLWGNRAVCTRLLFVESTKRDFWTEAVSHRVEKEFDKGAVLKALKVPIKADDTVETLYARLLPFEHRAQIETLQDFSEGTVKEITRTEPLVRLDEYYILEECKDIAKKLYPNG